MSKGFSVKDISEPIGTELNMVLGGDILRESNFFVDRETKKIKFSATVFDVAGTHVKFEFFSNVPIINFQCGEKVVKAFLDTGAKQSFLNREIIPKDHPLGKVWDVCIFNLLIK
jgi:hypothetical protein